MNKLIVINCFSLALASTSLAANWPAATLKDYKSAKSLQEYLCAKQPQFGLNKKVCDLSQRDLANLAVPAQLPKLKSKNSMTLLLDSGTTTLSLKRAKEPTVFEINARSINVKDITNAEDLVSTVRKALPQKVSARWSLIVPEAQASETSLMITYAIVGLITDTIKMESCEIIRSIPGKCQDTLKNVDAALQAALLLSRDKLSSASSSLRDMAIERQKHLQEIQRLRVTMGILQQTVRAKVTPLFANESDALKVCSCMASPDQCQKADAGASQRAEYIKCDEAIKKINQFANSQGTDEQLKTELNALEDFIRGSTAPVMPPPETQAPSQVPAQAAPDKSH